MTISKRHFGYLGFFGLLGLAAVFTGNTGFYGFFGFGHAIRRTLRVAAGAGQASRERGVMAHDGIRCGRSCLDENTLLQGTRPHPPGGGRDGLFSLMFD